MGIQALIDTQVLTVTGSTGDVMTVQADGSYLAETPAGASPGGSSGEIQYNNAGAFGGTVAVVYAGSGSHLSVTAQAATDVPVTVKGAVSQTANLTEWKNSTGAEVHSIGLGSTVLTLRDPADLTRYLKVDIIAGQCKLYSQSGFSLASSNGIGIQMGGGSPNTLVSTWLVGGAYWVGGTSASRGIFAGAGLSTSDANVVTSNGYGSAGRLNANKTTWNTGRGTVLSGYDSGNGGDFIFDFGCGGDATTGAAGTHGCLKLNVDTAGTGVGGDIINFNGVASVRGSGTIRPAQLADGSAENDSIYYSTTAGKLVYKDSAGTVNNLY